MNIIEKLKNVNGNERNNKISESTIEEKCYIRRFRINN